MNLSRISKKTPHVDNRETLPSLHSQKLKEFADQRATLPDKEQLLGQLITQYESDNSNNNIDMYDLYDRIELYVSSSTCAVYDRGPAYGISNGITTYLSKKFKKIIIYNQ